MANIDLDDEFLKLFFSVTNKNVPSDVNLRDIKAQLIDIVDVIRNLNENSKKPYKSDALGNNTPEQGEDGEDLGPAILVVDDLGVIT